MTFDEAVAGLESNDRKFTTFYCYSFSSPELDNEKILRLSRALMRNTSVRRLTLEFDHPSEYVLNCFSEAVASSMVEQLIITCSKLDGLDLTQFHRNLWGSTFLRSFSFDRNKLSLRKCFADPRTSAMRSGVEELDLSGNKLGEDIAENAMSAFSCYPALRFLNLSFNDIGIEGSTVPCWTSLPRDQLVKLWLSGNPIGDKLDDSFRQMLAMQTKLEFLGLDSVNLDLTSARVLFQGISENTSLREVSISGHCIPQSSLSELSVLLAQNFTIKRVYGVCDPVFDDVLQRNNRIVEALGGQEDFRGRSFSGHRFFLGLREEYDSRIMRLEECQRVLSEFDSPSARHKMRSLGLSLSSLHYGKANELSLPSSSSPVGEQTHLDPIVDAYKEVYPSSPLYPSARFCIFELVYTYLLRVENSDGDTLKISRLMYAFLGGLIALVSQGCSLLVDKLSERERSVFDRLMWDVSCKEKIDGVDFSLSREFPLVSDQRGELLAHLLDWVCRTVFPELSQPLDSAAGSASTELDPCDSVEVTVGVVNQDTVTVLRWAVWQTYGIESIQPSKICQTGPVA